MDELAKALRRAADADMMISDEMNDDDFAFAALGREIERLRSTTAQLRAWGEDRQVWAVNGSYMDGYQAARRDVLRRLDSETA